MRERAARAIVVALAAWTAAAPAAAFTTDARRLAMGSVLTPGGGELAVTNVAYQAMPARRDGRGAVVPLPLGLAQLAADFPTFDAQDPDFSITRIANLAASPPFFLELRSPQNQLDGDIEIAIGRNAFSIDFADARELLPQAPVDMGGVYARPLFGLGIRGARTYVAPLVSLEGRVAFDDALYAALARGEALQPNSTYAMQADGEAMAGTSFNVGWSGGGWGRDGGDGLYLGSFAKYILGFGFGRADSRFTLATADTIFGDNDPLDVGYDAMTRVSRFGRLGNGIGFDVGAAYRRRGFDVGLGVRDLGAQVRWSATEVEHTFLDDTTGEMQTETLATGEGYTSRLPVQTAFNVAWTGGATLLAADLVTSRWGTTGHLGAERRVGPLALRAGLLTDERERLQYAWGAGIGAAHVWVDVGFQTHNRSITGERGLTLGTSLAIR
jgi:hypothetical protein